MTEPGERNDFNLFDELKGLRRSIFRLANAVVGQAITYAEGVSHRKESQQPGGAGPDASDKPENMPEARQRELPADKMTAVALQFMEKRGPGVAFTAHELAYAAGENELRKTPEQAARWLVAHSAELIDYMDQDKRGLKFEDVSGEGGLPEMTFVVAEPQNRTQTESSDAYRHSN